VPGQPQLRVIVRPADESRWSRSAHDYVERGPRLLAMMKALASSAAEAVRFGDAGHRFYAP
jgi:hypothetical protein